MYLCVGSSKRRIPGSLTGEGKHLEEKKLQGCYFHRLWEMCRTPRFKIYLMVFNCSRSRYPLVLQSKWMGMDGTKSSLFWEEELDCRHLIVSVKLVIILLVPRVVQVLFALQQSLLMLPPSLHTAYKETQDSIKLIATICPVRTVRLDMRHCHSRLKDKNSHIYWWTSIKQWGCAAGGNPFPDRFAECWVSFLVLKF